MHIIYCVYVRRNAIFGTIIKFNNYWNWSKFLSRSFGYIKREYTQTIPYTYHICILYTNLFDDLFVVTHHVHALNITLAYSTNGFYSHIKCKNEFPIAPHTHTHLSYHTTAYRALIFFVLTTFQVIFCLALGNFTSKRIQFLVRSMSTPRNTNTHSVKCLIKSQKNEYDFHTSWVRVNRTRKKFTILIVCRMYNFV